MTPDANPRPITGLDTRSSYPTTRSYVLKLHRDAGPRTESLCGRLEHITTGRHYDFHGGDELLRLLALDVPTLDGRSFQPDLDA
jgi:hypothetical protein